MDRFIARENVKHLREHLASDIDAKTRAEVTRQLVGEEDKLGADYELLADLDQHIRRGHTLIAWQTGLVESMERDGHDGLARAKSLLHGLTDSHDLHVRYRQRVLARIEENKLLG